ncbi:MAG: hypothetical protein DMF22_12445 [Verrucomicrobia bacterium]|nr:MAG: hypothetical protein DMF22_12445 [Verrucomicrobiota bacterium]
MKREAVIDPSLEKTLLSLHAAMNCGSFWKAIRHLLAAAMPNRLIGLMLQPNPILPMIARWTLPSRSRVISLRNRVRGSCGLATCFQIEAA